MGQEVGTGTADDFAFPGITVTPPVSPNSTTVFYATATVGTDVSACSSTLSTPSGSVTYVEDETPPDASIDSGPSGLTNDTTPSFTFSATDAAQPVTFQCSIDTGSPSYGPCSGPGNSDTAGAPLAEGPYTFHLQATDAAGNSTVVSQSFEVDATPPSVAVDSGPTGTTGETRPTFTFSGSDTHGPVTFLCSIDTGTASFGACSGPGNSDTPSAPLAGGAHVFRAQGTDAAGNSAVATRSFTVGPAAGARATGHGDHQGPEEEDHQAAAEVQVHLEPGGVGVPVSGGQPSVRSLYLTVQAAEAAAGEACPSGAGDRADRRRGSGAGGQEVQSGQLNRGARI